MTQPRRDSPARDAEQCPPAGPAAGGPSGGQLDPERIFFPPASSADRIRSAAALVRHGPALVRWSGVAVRAFGGSRLAAVRRLRALRRRGYLFDDAVHRGLLDPSIADGELNGFASRHVALIAQREANPDSFEDLTTQKAIFYRYCAAVGLPTPPLIAILHRGTAGWGAGDRVLDDADDFAALLDDHRVDLVVKPSDGGKGVGVRVLRREGPLLADAAGDGAPMSPQHLWTVLRNDPDHRCFVVQERMRNRADIAVLSPGPALNTIRLVTLVTRSGLREVVQCSIRLGLGGGVIDNFGDGSTGNGYAVIDPDTGTMGPLLVARPDGAGFLSSPTIPASGIRVEGMELPGWGEAVDLAFSATAHFLPLRSVGWDIALTDRGAMIVEANREWTPITQADLLSRLARVARA